VVKNSFPPTYQELLLFHINANKVGLKKLNVRTMSYQPLQRRNRKNVDLRPPHYHKKHCSSPICSDCKWQTNNMLQLLTETVITLETYFLDLINKVLLKDTCDNQKRNIAAAEQ
jgi:hypothetical protein